MTANVSSEELLTLLGSKEAELFALRRDNAKLTTLASELNTRVAELQQILEQPRDRLKSKVRPMPVGTEENAAQVTS